jgi:toxin-antitoxin system PIN domain toxin
VIAIDTNVLVHAHRMEMPMHAAARRRLTELAEGNASWAIPVFCIGELVRVLTHPRIFDPPYTTVEVRAAVQRVLASPSLRVLVPGGRFVPLFLDAVVEGGATGNLAFDAQIVALCREHGVSHLVTEDRDFVRFKGLVVERLDEGGRGPT